MEVPSFSDSFFWLSNDFSQTSVGIADEISVFLCAPRPIFLSGCYSDEIYGAMRSELSILFFKLPKIQALSPVLSHLRVNQLSALPKSPAVTLPFSSLPSACTASTCLYYFRRQTRSLLRQLVRTQTTTAQHSTLSGFDLLWVCPILSYMDCCRTYAL